jgi:hypothetical protein
MIGLSDIQTAASGLSAIIEVIDKIVARRAEKRRQKALRKNGQYRFIHEFSFAGAPEEDPQEQTIRSYCKKLQEIIYTHWGFIFGRGSYNAEAAHAFMASTMFHVAALPGLPPAPKPQNIVTGCASCLHPLNSRKLDANISQCFNETLRRY